MNNIKFDQLLFTHTHTCKHTCSTEYYANYIWIFDIGQPVRMIPCYNRTFSVNLKKQIISFQCNNSSNSSFVRFYYYATSEKITEPQTLRLFLHKMTILINRPSVSNRCSLYLSYIYFGNFLKSMLKSGLSGRTKSRENVRLGSNQHYITIQQFTSFFSMIRLICTMYHVQQYDRRSASSSFTC